MRHRGILKNKEQQAAYLTNREKAKIAERRHAHRKTQHSKEQTFENANKNKKSRRKSYQMPKYHKQITLNQPHHQNEGLQTHITTASQKKQKKHLLKQMQSLSPNMTPRRTPACQKLNWEKQQWDMSLDSYLKEDGSGQKHQIGKMQN